MSTDPRNPRSRPLYSQIRELLIGRMLSGDWRPGHMLPSEFKIAEEYGVSQGTVRKAIEDMEAEKLVVRRQGKGTFVIARSLPATHFHFFRIKPDDGGKLPTPGNEILFLRKDEPSRSETKALELKQGAQVYRLHRVRKFQNVPVMLEKIVMPETIFPNFEEIYLADPQPHIYAVFERRYGIVVLRAEERIKAVAPLPDDAVALRLEPTTPILEIDRVGFGIGDRPTEIRQMLVHTANYHYQNTLV